MNWVIDAHHHVWDLSVRPQPWIAGEAMARVARSFGVADLIEATIGQGIGQGIGHGIGHGIGQGIDRTVVVQTVAAPDETSELLALAASTLLIGAVVGWVDLAVPDVAGRLAALREMPGGEWLAGIRHQVQAESDPRWLCRVDVRAGLNAVAAAGLVYELLTLPHQLEAAIETVRALPELSFVLDHLSKPSISSGGLEPWASRIRQLAAFPNVTCKLSGMVTEADWKTWTIDDLRPYANVVLDAFGPRRVMFGSDYPVCLLAASYAEVRASAEALTEHLHPDDRALVFGGTAERIYACR